MEETQLSQRKSWHYPFTAKDIDKETLGGDVYILDPTPSLVFCAAHKTSLSCKTAREEKYSHGWGQQWLGIIQTDSLVRV